MRLLARIMCAGWLVAGGFGLALLPNVEQALGQGTGDPVISGGKEMLLWPDRAGGANGAPLAAGNGPADRPTLRVYLPKAPNPTRTGVLVTPGGGYEYLSMQNEGEDIALWLNARGVAAFVLKYRVGPVYRHPVELRDAQRAIRTVRARAAEFGVAADHVGMWGFSAGGHLAATAGTRFDAGDAGSADLVERAGSRPDFLLLSYPVITMDERLTHPGSRNNLLGEHPDPAVVAELSAEKQVTAQTPPTFLYATTDDEVVPVANSVMFYTALTGAGVSAEVHLFEHGPHGTGLAGSFPDLKGWPELAATWMRARGLMGIAAGPSAGVGSGPVGKADGGHR